MGLKSSGCGGGGERSSARGFLGMSILASSKSSTFTQALVMRRIGYSSVLGGVHTIVNACAQGCARHKSSASRTERPYEGLFNTSAEFLLPKAMQFATAYSMLSLRDSVGT